MIMWTTFRVLFSRVIRILMPWIMSEAGKFTAKYWEEAKAAVRKIEETSDLKGREKFEYACKALIILLKDRGAEYMEYCVQDAIQSAFGALYKELHEKKGK